MFPATSSTRILNHRFLNKTASFDVASDSWQALLYGRSLGGGWWGAAR
jgi:hypothetical protein